MSRDVSPPVHATLRAAGIELVRHIEGYESPQFHSGWDANALRRQIELDLQRCGRFHASHRPTIYTIELERFAHQLRALNQETEPGRRASSTEPTRSA